MKMSEDNKTSNLLVSFLNLNHPLVFSFQMASYMVSWGETCEYTEADLGTLLRLPGPKTLLDA